MVVPGATAGAPLERDLVVLYGYSDEATDYRAVAFNADAGPFSIPLGGVPANHQTAADVDGDGLVDVLLSRSDTSELFVLRRTNAATPFAAIWAFSFS